MSLNELRELLEQCENDVRLGRGNAVGRRLAKIETASFPRELRLPFANICRRIGLFGLGFKFLTPAVKPGARKTANPATDAELAEYAVLLQMCGAFGEAAATLERVDARKVPSALLYRAFGHFNLWDYEAALPYLRSYLQHEITPYQAIVGEVNLAAALVATSRTDEALALLGQLIEKAKASEAWRLAANSHELRAQLHLRQKNFSKATRDLDEALKLLGDEMSFDRFIIEKWRAILESEQNRASDRLEKFRGDAIAKRDSHSLREADLYLLKREFSEMKFDHLYFGSPYEGYREKIARELGREPKSQTYTFGRRGRRTLDLATGEGSSLSPGKKIHQLLAVLLTDFYRPQRVGGLFAGLFPGEHFDVFSSPDRVHQVLWRTREWIRQEKLPLQIEEHQESYSLQITGTFGIEVHLNKSKIDDYTVTLERLRTSMPTAFATSEACTQLSISSSTFQSFAATAIAKGDLTRTGKGPATRYHLAA